MMRRRPALVAAMVIAAAFTLSLAAFGQATTARGQQTSQHHQRKTQDAGNTEHCNLGYALSPRVRSLREARAHFVRERSKNVKTSGRTNFTMPGWSAFTSSYSDMKLFRISQSRRAWLPSREGACVPSVTKR